MARKALTALVLLLSVVAVAGVFLSRPRLDPPDILADLAGDADRGQLVFDAGGCAACHAAPKAEGAARLVLSGGREFASPFGTFVAPNISSDRQAGIGAWAPIDLWNALHNGTSPERRHYYPAFPYTSYVNATPQDVVDLFAYLKTLPADPTPSQPHAVGFPFNIRAGLGPWKALFFRPGWVVDLPPEASEQLARGRYLAEALGHCGECHTPRNLLGARDKSRWLAGAPIPGARGSVPNITPARLDWSEADLVEYFTSGFTPEYDSAGGAMVEVIENLARLPRADRAALAAYLKAVPPVE